MARSYNRRSRAAGTTPAVDRPAQRNGGGPDRAQARRRPAYGSRGSSSDPAAGGLSRSSVSMRSPRSTESS